MGIDGEDIKKLNRRNVSIGSDLTAATSTLCDTGEPAQNKIIYAHRLPLFETTIDVDVLSSWMESH